MNLQTPIEAVAGVGYHYAQKLHALNISTVWDLLTHFPFRYEDFTNAIPALEAKEGEKITLQGEIWSIKNVYTRFGRVLTQAIFNDGTTPVSLTWFNQGYLTKTIKPGDKLQISGKVTRYKNKLSIVAPAWERLSTLDQKPASSNAIHTGRLVPVYPETEGISSKWLRNKIDFALPLVKEFIADTLPSEIRGEMLPLEQAIEQIHFPKDLNQAKKARERLSFDELFYIQLATQKVRKSWKEKPTVEAFRLFPKEMGEFIKNLPFDLTGAQKRVISEIEADLAKNTPMNRLVQGEVGSGKTVVAAVVIYLAYLNGLKSFYMAPTEILAFQHHSTLSNLLEKYGVKVGIYTGSRKFNKFTPSPLTLNPDIVIGTHALLSGKLSLEDVGLVVIDEQQRFGVEQRSLLRSKAKIPHFLTMTATPIPRTVALTMYGDLDLSVIDELPKNRQPIKTFVVPAKKRQDAYGFIEKKIKEGDQAYIITPLIELSETMQSVRAATSEFERLQKKVFPNLRLGLLHGRLKPKEKEQVLNDFKDHKLDILVSTSVVEVGVDVTNATIMVVESAERFGLAQLHQLRGRVGRGHKESFTLLFTDSYDSSAINRLKNMEKINDGLKLAELDLKIRGGGEIFGTRQSGRFELKIASLYDLPLVEKTRDAAQKLLKDDPNLDKYPSLASKLQDVTAGASPD